jgi:hypothetical protein
MSTADPLERRAEPSLGTVPGKAEPTKIYGGDALPPGAVGVAHRVVARFAPPGRTAGENGIPPIGLLILPGGEVIADLYDDDTAEEVRVLPFRFPWYSRAYSIRTPDGSTLHAVMRNIQASELMSGAQVVVQFNESHDWSAYFGTVEKPDGTGFKLRLPSGELRPVPAEEIQFVGKVAGWWDDSVKAARDAAAEHGEGGSGRTVVASEREHGKHDVVL